MAFPIFYNGAILFRGGALAFSTNCCCDLCPAPVTITYQIDLSGSDQEVVADVDLDLYTGGAQGFRLVLVFESFCCTGIPNSVDNNSRFVYYSFYSCGAGTNDIDIAFGEFITATYGGIPTPAYSTPQLITPATNVQVDDFIDAVKNSAASGGDDALSVSYFRDLNFGCPC